MDEKMRGLRCNLIQVDEIWGFIGMKERTAKAQNAGGEVGDVWTWIAIDAETKLVPTFAVGDRTQYMANVFIEDLASRLSHRVQISSDALPTYATAIERAFGCEVDYGSILKTFSHTTLGDAPILPAEVVNVTRKPVAGNPVVDLIDKLRGRSKITRGCTAAASRGDECVFQKLENWEAAVALHYGYYNFVKTLGDSDARPLSRPV